MDHAYIDGIRLMLGFVNFFSGWLEVILDRGSFTLK